MSPALKALADKVRAAAGNPLFREFLNFGSSSIFMQGSRVASGLVVAGLLGPAAWGSWYLLNLIIAYGALSHLGATSGMNREVPAALGRDDAAEAAALRHTTLGVVVASVAAASLLLLVAAALVPGVIGLRELGLMLMLLAVHQIFDYTTTALRATTRFVVVARLQFAMAVAYPAFAIAGAWTFGLEGFIVGQALAYALVCVLGAQSPEVTFRPRLGRARAKALIAIGFPIMLVGVVSTLFATVDRWVVAGFLGAESLGHYSLAIMSFGAVGLLPQVIYQQFYPRVAFAWSARGDRQELRRLARLHRNLTFAAVAPVVAVLVIIAPPAVRTLLPDFSPGIPALMITMFVPVVSAIGQGYVSILHVLDRQAWLLGAIAASATVNVAVSAVLVRPYGLAGVALGTVLAYALFGVLRVVLGEHALRRVGEARRGLP